MFVNHGLLGRSAQKQDRPFCSCSDENSDKKCTKSGGESKRTACDEFFGFAQYDPCLLWKNGAETDAGSWIWNVLSGWILAITKTLPDRISMCTGMLVCTAVWLMFSYILIS